MNRRLALSAVALAGVAACAPGSATAFNVQKVMLQAQFLLPLADVLLAGVAVAVPGAAPAIMATQPFLAAAGKVFQTISATMTDVQAKPLVQQIEDYVGAALKAISGVVMDNPKLAPLASKLSQAQAVLALLDAFVSGVSTVPTAAAVPVPLLHR
jgi:hypothetical protein